jgi:predicted permease
MNYLVFLQFLFFIFLGFLLRRAGVARERHVKAVHSFALYIILPTLMFNVLVTADYSNLSALLMTPLVFVIAVLSSAVLAFLLFRNHKNAGTILLCAPLANTAYFGFPVCYAFYGETGLLAAVFATLGFNLGPIFMPAIISAYYGGGRAHLKDTLRRILTFPPLIATVFAAFVIWSSLSIPEFVLSATHFLGIDLVPLIVLSIGASLYYDKKHLNPVLRIALFRLLVPAIIAYFLGIYLSLESPFFEVAILESVMPVALTTIAFSRWDEALFDGKLVSSAIFVTTLLSLLTLPVLFFILSVY